MILFSSRALRRRGGSRGAPEEEEKEEQEEQEEQEEEEEEKEESACSRRTLIATVRATSIMVCSTRRRCCIETVLAGSWMTAAVSYATVCSVGCDELSSDAARAQRWHPAGQPGLFFVLCVTKRPIHFRAPRVPD